MTVIYTKPSNSTDNLTNLPRAAHARRSGGGNPITSAAKGIGKPEQTNGTTSTPRPASTWSEDQESARLYISKVDVMCSATKCLPRHCEGNHEEEGRRTYLTRWKKMQFDSNLLTDWLTPEALIAAASAGSQDHPRDTLPDRHRRPLIKPSAFKSAPAPPDPPQSRRNTPPPQYTTFATEPEPTTSPRATHSHATR